MGLGILRKTSLGKHKSKSNILTHLERTDVKSSNLKLVLETTDVVSTTQKGKRTILIVSGAKFKTTINAENLSKICCHPVNVFFRDISAYSIKTMSSHNVHVLQQHGFLVRRDRRYTRPGWFAHCPSYFFLFWGVKFRMSICLQKTIKIIKEIIKKNL